MYKTKRRRAPKPPSREHQLQSACVKWFRYQYPNLNKNLFAIPNGANLGGGKNQRGKEGAKLKREGLVPGVADLFLAVPSGAFPGLFIEMKTPAGVQRYTQKAFETAVVHVGYGYAIPRTLDEFMRIVKSYLENGTF